MSSTGTERAGSEMPDAVTFREVQEIIRIFRGSGWRSMTLELRGLRIAIGKDGPPAAASAAVTAPAAPAAPVEQTPSRPASTEWPTASAPASGPGGGGGTASPTPDPQGCIAVRSPAVGGFWVAPSPGQQPFVEVGQHVDEEQQLAIVEVMKLMNPVVSATAGEVVEVCAANGDMVEYDQVLFWVRPDGG